MLIFFLISACAPEPWSIKLDGPETVTVHTRATVPVPHAVVLDRDDKPLDPQPIVDWSVDGGGVVTLNEGAVSPVKDGVARIKARVGDVATTYAFAVELEQNARPDSDAPVSHNGCQTVDYGNGVYLFQCGSSGTTTSDFSRALSAFVKDRPSVEVVTVAAMPMSGKQYNYVDGYLVLTRQHGE